jgi:hypothetical protein
MGRKFGLDSQFSSSSSTKTRNSFTFFKAASFVKKASQPEDIVVATCKASGNLNPYRILHSAAYSSIPASISTIEIPSVFVNKF